MENIEKTVMDWLNESPDLSNHPSAFDVPSNRPERFISIERTGGATGTYMDESLVSVFVWDTSRWNASQACESAVERLKSMHELPEVALCEIISHYNNPDPVSGSPRYQINCRIVTHII